MLQILYRTGSPRQPSTEEHLLSCLETPPSQGREQTDQSDQADQPPLPRFLNRT